MGDGEKSGGGRCYDVDSCAAAAEEDARARGGREAKGAEEGGARRHAGGAGGRLDGGLPEPAPGGRARPASSVTGRPPLDEGLFEPGSFGRKL